MPLSLSEAEFEALVTEELDAIPDEIVSRLDNVAFIIEEEPDQDTDLLGVYQGVCLTERENYGHGELPDRIILFRRPLLDVCTSVTELRAEIHLTLVHEIGHYFGLNDEELVNLGWG